MREAPTVPGAYETLSLRISTTHSTMSSMTPPHSTQQILLVRHGRAQYRPSAWLDQTALRRWQVAYDAGGLKAGELPPASLVEDVSARLTSHTGVVVCSDLLRAIESAALLAPGAGVVQSAHLRETHLPIPDFGRLRLPHICWGIAMGLRWKRRLRNEPVNANNGGRKQGAEASAWLESLLEQHQSVIAVTHGVTRQYIADALTARGWRAPQSRMAFNYWSAWEFAR